MPDTFRRRFLIALVLSLAVHFVFVSQARRAGFDIPSVTETVTIHHAKIVKWVVPTPKPVPTPPTRWSQLDRSMVKKIRLTPADEQIVVLAARRGSLSPADG